MKLMYVCITIIIMVLNILQNGIQNVILFKFEKDMNYS